LAGERRGVSPTWKATRFTLPRRAYAATLAWLPIGQKGARSLAFPTHSRQGFDGVLYCAALDNTPVSVSTPQTSLSCGDPSEGSRKKPRIAFCLSIKIEAKISHINIAIQAAPIIIDGKEARAGPPQVSLWGGKP
jgi:hypothetical protein